MYIAALPLPFLWFCGVQLQCVDAVDGLALVLIQPKLNREFQAVRGSRSLTIRAVFFGTGWEVFCVVGRRSTLAASE